jgi:ABC-2 type transport system permease protein
LVALVQLSSLESLDWAGIFTSYVGLFLLASVYLAAGIFASALTSNQMVALLLGLGFGLLLTEGIPQLVGLGLLEGNAYYILQLGLSYHYESISRGVIDSRDIVYFISLTTLFLLAAKTWIQKRNWS